MSRSLLPGVIAMAVIVIASNILVQFLVGDWLTWGAFTYPFAFLVTDLMNRLHGAPAARRVVLAGFVVGPGLQLRRQPDRGAVRAAGQPARGDRVGGGVPGRPADGRRGLQPAARRQLVARALRVERRGQRARHRDLLPARLLRGARLRRARGRRRPGPTRWCRSSAAGRWRRSGCRWRWPISRSSSPSRSSRWRRSGPHSAGTRSATLRFALAFCGGAGTIRRNRNQRKEVIQCRVRLWSVRPG